MPAQQEREKAGTNNQLKAVSAATKQSKSTIVILGGGLPALTEKLVDKIEAGEYIDFTELPPARGKSRSVLPAVEGQVLVVQAVDLLQSHWVIPDLATWLQCFAIYAAVIVSKQLSIEHCQSIDHTSECCPLVSAYPNSMEAGLQGRILRVKDGQERH